MESPSFCYNFILLSFLLPFLVQSSSSSSSLQHRCHEDEKFALLQFKQNFTIINDIYCFSKFSSWKIEADNNNNNNLTNCCLWDGIECDEANGHIISLNLRNSCLHGSLSSNSTLFNLVSLERLDLSNNHFNYSSIPSQLSNLSKLTYLNLSNSAFIGQIPSQLSKLSKLSTLDLSYNTNPYYQNPYLESNLLSLQVEIFTSLIHNLTSIQTLCLRYVNISSSVPKTVANLSSSLTTLDLRGCQLSGEFPASIFLKPNLEKLDIAWNTELKGHLPDFPSSNSLKHVSLYRTSFSGKLPYSIGNIGSLDLLNLGYCNFSGPIPSSLGNLTQLYFLNLAFNSFTGYIPHSLGNLTRLIFFSLQSNMFQGQIPHTLFQNKNLEVLVLRDNNMSGIVELDKFSVLNKLLMLSLSDNKFSVLIKKNSNTTFPHFHYLNLASSGLSGEIYPLVCNLSSLYILDLSFNNFKSKLPQCLESYGSSLSVLNLKGNNFYGSIPQTWRNAKSLRMLDLSQNKFAGQLPRDLANCTMLEVLDIADNQIEDTFPSWLGALPELKILVMRFNRFYGSITTHPKTKNAFSKLQIIDISHNKFSGNLFSSYFQQFSVMAVCDKKSNATYLNFVMRHGGYFNELPFSYSTKITNKGTDRSYPVINELLKVLDFSSNRFEGEIPKLMGNLKCLTSLNFSNNYLKGSIPSSLGNLTDLEALDLSYNQLSGEIPSELTQLNFLETFTVAHNLLKGPIPHGKQFDTFPVHSFEGNMGLCGNPLPKKCGKSRVSSVPTPSTLEKKNLGFPFEYIGWKTVGIGYGFGIAVGIVTGHFLIVWKRVGSPRLSGELCK